jgi:hypothetical protein
LRKNITEYSGASMWLVLDALPLKFVAKDLAVGANSQAAIV